MQDGDSGGVVLTVRVLASLSEARRAARIVGATARDLGFAVEGHSGATLLIARSMRGVEVLREMLASGRAATVDDLDRATTCRHLCAAVARPPLP